MDRLLRTLNDAIDQARIPRELPFLRAERATLLARFGELEAARQEVNQLRTLPETADNGVLHAWLWLAESLIDFHQDLSVRARDRVRRAMALARSVRAPRIQSLAAAWLAHMEFRDQQDLAAVEHARQAMLLSGPEHHSARARASIVIAGMYQFAGREDLSQPWYALARTHATKEGDTSVLTSIAYNLAVLRLIGVRLAKVFGSADSLALKRARLGMESSASLDRAVHNRALNHHSPIQQAQILVIHGEFEAALAIYDTHLRDALAQGLQSSECLYEADRALCLLELGRGDAALAAARRAESAFIVATELEEQAVAHAELAEVFGRLGLPDVSERHQQAAQNCHDQLQQRCNRLLDACEAAQLDEFLSVKVPD